MGWDSSRSTLAWQKEDAVTFQTGEGRGLLPGTFGGQRKVRKAEACTVVPI